MILSTSDLNLRINQGSLARYFPDNTQIKPTEIEVEVGSAAWSDNQGGWIWTLIDNLPKDFKIEGSVYNFRLDNIFTHLGGAGLLIDNRYPGKLQTVLPLQNKFSLRPHIPVIMQTIEIVNMPKDLILLVSPQIDLLRSGITLYTVNISPNYFGSLFFLAENITNQSIIIEKGLDIAQGIFTQIS